MKYTFTDQNGKSQVLTIPDDFISINCRNLGISQDEAIDMWLCDEGYITNPVVEMLTEKAKGVKVDHGVQAKSRKTPQRKPNAVKRALIQAFYTFLADNNNNPYGLSDSVESFITDIEIQNIERTITFNVGKDGYELTLAKKRAPKS